MCLVHASRMWPGLVLRIPLMFCVYCWCNDLKWWQDDWNDEMAFRPPFDVVEGIVDTWKNASQRT